MSIGVSHTPKLHSSYARLRVSRVVFQFVASSEESLLKFMVLCNSQYGQQQACCEQASLSASNEQWSYQAVGLASRSRFTSSIKQRVLR